MQKKIVLLAAFFISCPQLSAHQDDYASGRSKISAIMRTISAQPPVDGQFIQYAQTRNLVKELLISEMAASFGCKTLMGREFLADTLARPLSPDDTSGLRDQRQNAIRAFVESPELRARAEEYLELARQAEEEVIILFSDYFKGETCPELQRLELARQQMPQLAKLSELLITNPTGKTVHTLMQGIGIIGGLSASAFLSYLIYKSNAGLWADQNRKFTFFTAYCLLGALLGTYMLYQDYSQAVQKRSKMHALNQIVILAEKLEKLCSEYAITTQHNMSRLHDLQGIELIKGLKHARYKKKDMTLFMTPSVHTFLYEIYRKEAHLAPFFACIAEIDVYLAIANKIVASQSTEHPYCFTNFIESRQPRIEAESCWHVLIPHPVTNDFCEHCNVLLSGPNAGGKSIYIRMLLQNLVFSQAYGVAAGKRFDHTPFNTINSFINTSDDLMNGLSLFASEVKRAQEIIETIRGLPANHKFFFALDELFTGTAAEQGEKCACEFVKRIATSDRVQFIYATHFDKLKELGNNHSSCVNYKVDAPHKGANGKLIYPFTVSKGASDINVALDIAQDAGLFA